MRKLCFSFLLCSLFMNAFPLELPKNAKLKEQHIYENGKGVELYWVEEYVEQDDESICGDVISIWYKNLKTRKVKKLFTSSSKSNSVYNKPQLFCVDNFSFLTDDIVIISGCFDYKCLEYRSILVNVYTNDKVEIEGYFVGTTQMNSYVITTSIEYNLKGEKYDIVNVYSLGGYLISKTRLDFSEKK